jgi:hypothetical protein
MQAFVKGESDDGIPVNQGLVMVGHVISSLMLPSDIVRYSIQPHN